MDQDARPVLLRDPRLYLVFGITLMGVMGVSSIAPAFPRIADALDLSSRRVGLLLTVFTVPGIALAPILGFLSDRWGRKRIVVPALLLFGVSGAACAGTRSFPLLLVFRFLQGVGASSLTSLSVTLLGDIYADADRERAVGYNASVLSIGTASYPIVGGALAAPGWRYPFLLSLVALPIALAVVQLLPDRRPGGGGTTVLSQVSAVIRNARERGIVTLSLLAVLVFVLLYGAYLAYMPFLLEERFGAPSLLVGIVMSTMSIATAAVASQYGWLARRLSTGTILTFGSLFYAVALTIVPLMPTIWLILPGTLIYGTAQGLTIPTIQSQIAGRAPTHLRGATVAANAMAIRIGQTLGPLITGAIYVAGGIRLVFFLTATVPALMIVLIWSSSERPTRDRQ